jgi:hypothetical protein
VKNDHFLRIIPVELIIKYYSLLDRKFQLDVAKITYVMGRKLSKL